MRNISITAFHSLSFCRYVWITCTCSHLCKGNSTQLKYWFWDVREVEWLTNESQWLREVAWDTNKYTRLPKLANISFHKISFHKGRSWLCTDPPPLLQPKKHTCFMHHFPNNEDWNKVGTLTPKDNITQNSYFVDLIPITANHNNARLKKGMCGLTRNNSRYKQWMIRMSRFTSFQERRLSMWSLAQTEIKDLSLVRTNKERASFTATWWQIDT